ncbi:hypothetical protein DFP72DRAFT_877002 [Ephemerocybe angulata]|uniref:Sodium/calcium exchanger membrane region domain-containing protein n=1 Tax=Ephemerocybe angulata TaxID=980116 RepID=A0A8H6IFD2_9AGAR|nr:hypothetical protein DFP72DRAFT_877002 [Tulosesus angulatus]
MSSHVHIQEGPFVKEPLSIHVEDAEAGNEHSGLQDPHPNAQAPPSATSERRRNTLMRRVSRMSHNNLYLEAEDSVIRFWDRFTRKGKKNIGVWASLKAIVLSSWLNLFLVFVPIAWASHFRHWPQRLTFTFAFLAIIPLEWLVEWCGEEMAHYLGKDFGDLLIVTLHNSVEATLAIILLRHCEISLLKSTIIGVVILHLLLVPGTAFVAGGARILQQDLHPHLTELNHSLLTLGVLSLTLPAAFFASLSSNFNPVGTAESNSVIVNDALRGNLLKMSHGMAFCLLFIYICSRVYLHNPPGDETTNLRPEVPAALKEEEHHLQTNDPHINQYICIALLAVTIGLMAATAEWSPILLGSSLLSPSNEPTATIRWFGLILLPLVSYAADGTVAIVYFVRHTLRHIFREPAPPELLARGRAIDLSIQFLLFWMPFFVLLGWWTNKPMTLLFDFFEVAILVGACFIVNYVTADSKTNWAEGATMVSFYVMIATCAWFYPGQPEALALSECTSVAEALEALASGHSLSAAEIH